MDFSFRERILVKGIPHRYFLMLNFQHCGLSWIAGVLYFRGIHFQKPCFKLKLSVGNSTNLVTKGKIILCIQWTHWYRILWTRCQEVNKFHRLTLRWILIGCFCAKNLWIIYCFNAHEVWGTCEDVYGYETDQFDIRDMHRIQNRNPLSWWRTSRPNITSVPISLGVPLGYSEWHCTCLPRA